MANEGEVESWGWVRPLIYGASGLGAVVAALLGVSGSFKDEPEPSGTIGSRLYQIEIWKAQHTEEAISRRAELHQEATTTAEAIRNLRSETAELRRRIDSIVDRDSRRGGNVGGLNSMKGTHP